MSNFPDSLFRFERDPAKLESLFRAPRAEIEAYQYTRLKPILEYCWKHVPFYRDLWSKAGVSLSDIRSVGDLGRLPTWDKYDQRRQIETSPPYGTYYRSKDPKEIAFLLSSGGTTGKSRVFPIMHDDLPGIKDILARTMRFIGVTEADIVQVCTHYSAYAGAWCGTWATEAVGAALVPTGSGKSMPSAKQVELLQVLGVTVLRAQASYIERLGEICRSEGIDPASLKVRKILTAGEAYSAERRARIEKDWNAAVYDFFGSSDTFSWSSVDCEHSRETYGTAGMHVWEDATIIEVLREDGTACESGEFGELTLTTLNWRNSPRIRFRTGDIAAVYHEQCGCGRNSLRMSPIKGRVDHVVRVKGVNLYPDAIDSVVTATDQRLQEFYAVATRKNGGDVLKLKVEWHDLADEALVTRMTTAFRDRLSVTPEIELVEIGSTLQKTGVDGSLNKPRRLFDDRIPS